MFDRTSLQHRKVICALIPVELPELGNLGLVRGHHPEHGARPRVVPPEPGGPLPPEVLQAVEGEVL